jgi:hypothetical protein
MTPEYSRRNFFKHAPSAVFLLATARNVASLSAPLQNPPTSGTGGPTPTRPTPVGGGNGGGGGPGPGPAQHGGDYQPPTLSGPYDRKKDKDPAPHKPRKDLAADQKTLRDDVRRLALDAQELSKAIAQFGPKQALPAELVGKTKDIEKLAHDIAELAKG